MAALELYMKKVYDHQPKHPRQIPESRFFPDSCEAPKLVKGKINRIILYNGAFNPPHQGHLSLLRHIFYHGVHDLNVVAAFVQTLADNYSLKKGRAAGGSFAFDRDTRCMLWKQHLHFPDWAWVHESDERFSGFLARLKEVTSADDFEVDYLPLKGPWEYEHISPWHPVDFHYGATMLIISDASRAADYQRSSGRIRNFTGYNKWKVLLKLNAHMAKEDVDDDKWSTQADDGHRSADRKSIPMDTAIHQDFKNIVQCRRSEIGDQKYQIRFVKTRENNRVKHSTDTSSTELRDIMSQKTRHRDMQSTLEDLALSGGLLWECREQWLDKAKSWTNPLISLQLPDGWTQKRLQMQKEVLELATCDFSKLEVTTSERAKTEMSKDENALTAGKDQDLKHNRTSTKKRKRASSVPVLEMAALSPFKRVRRMGEDAVGALRQSSIWGRYDGE
ncbi:MAG: hypothetical protein L6R37_006764 [Teloschistes peruensis]|nr:MAG: hypothetical protein L6R37_006764 [Teloschistes peruensis]